MARANFVKAARKDIPGTGIKKGDSYYWWKFRYGGKQFSKTAPKRSQLTQSAFYSALWDIEDRLSEADAADFSEPEDLQSFVEDIVSELETLRDEQEEKKSNMPDALQESPTGELLQERYDELNSMISDIEGVSCDDFEFDEEAAKEEVIDEIKAGITFEDEEAEESFEPNEEDVQDAANKKRSEALGEWIEEKLNELQGISYNGS